MICSYFESVWFFTGRVPTGGQNIRHKMMSEENQELIPKPTHALVEATRISDAPPVNQRQPLLDDLHILLILLLGLCALVLVCLAYYIAKSNS